MIATLLHTVGDRNEQGSALWLSRVWGSSIPHLLCAQLHFCLFFFFFFRDPEEKNSLSLHTASSSMAGEHLGGCGGTQEVTFPAQMRWEQRVKAQTEPATVCGVTPSGSQPPVKISQGQTQRLSRVK